MPPIKFSERLTKFMISISLSEKFCCQNLITSIKVITCKLRPLLLLDALSDFLETLQIFLLWDKAVHAVLDF